jgi:hypothetical protein
MYNKNSERSTYPLGVLVLGVEIQEELFCVPVEERR